MSKRMNELAATMPGYIGQVEKMPGYISHKGFWAEDGERVTIVEFEHEEGQRAWRTHPEHIKAQRLGRERYYAAYDIKVGTVAQHSNFDRNAKT